MDAVSIRGDWVGQVIDGSFPLLEWLGGSGGNAVFLTELAGSGSERAAIKLVTDPLQAEHRLAVWSSIAALSHPHLLRIHNFGRAEINGTKLAYVVTDLASEVLSEIIPERSLTADEAREMLGPVLDALGYLHQNGYVHGHLKPSNILVVGDEVKLSSDSMLRIGRVAPESPDSDGYAAPEITHAPVTPAADSWSLGMTLIEVLTQQPPASNEAAEAEPVVPASVPEPYSTIARECLRLDPLRRCSLEDVRAILEGRPRPVPPAPPQRLDRPNPAPPDVDRASRGEHAKSSQPNAPARNERTRSSSPTHDLRPRKPLPSRMPLLPLIIGFVLLVAIIVGLEMHSHKTNPAPLQTESTREAPAAEPDSHLATPAAPPSAAGPDATASASGEVLSRSMPNVPDKASNTIHGTVGVVVRVEVDAAGVVTHADLATRGPSAYFARLALGASRSWRFKPPQQDGRPVSSTWLLHYAFRRNGVYVKPEETKP
jgi:serine/threonine-protein kinase Stk1